MAGSCLCSNIPTSCRWSLWTFPDLCLNAGQPAFRNPVSYSCLTGSSRKLADAIIYIWYKEQGWWNVLGVVFLYLLQTHFKFFLLII